MDTLGVAFATSLRGIKPISIRDSRGSWERNERTLAIIFLNYFENF